MAHIHHSLKYVFLILFCSMACFL